jgi:hypothetical protein
MTAVPVMDFDTEPIRNRVSSAVTGSSAATSARPYPSARRRSPPATTDTVAPAMSCSSSWAGSRSSKNDRTASAEGGSVAVRAGALPVAAAVAGPTAAAVVAAPTPARKPRLLGSVDMILGVWPVGRGRR